MLSDGLVLMVIGMGTVFIFLVLMIYCMRLMMWILQKINTIFPEPVEKSVLAVARPIIKTPTASSVPQNSKLKQIALAIAAIKARQ